MYLPHDIIESLHQYANDGTEPGDFLRACLENNFIKAVTSADELTRAHLFDLACYMYRLLPPPSFGSPDAVHHWIQSGGLAGMENNNE